jgi:hypothetical protein
MKVWPTLCAVERAKSIATAWERLKSKAPSLESLAINTQPIPSLRRSASFGPPDLAKQALTPLPGRR